MNPAVRHIEELLTNLQAVDYRSWDHYDFWGSPIGIRLRRVKGFLRWPLVGTGFIIDILFPRSVRIGKPKEIAMETLPSIMRAMLVYFRETGDTRFEDDRERLYTGMIEQLGSSSHGRGVGHQFDWYTTVLIPAYTPCVTLTAYLVEYIFDSWGDSLAERELEVLKDIGEFVYRDLSREDLPDEKSRVAYTELDNRRVINANAYASLILLRLGKYFGRDDYLDLSQRLLRYVIGEQAEDGGWFYFEKGSIDESENFIDSFHTAFVIESLWEYSRLADTPEAGEAKVACIKGLKFFKTSFILPDGGVKQFLVKHLPIEASVDTRCLAEGANLMSIAGTENQELLIVADSILGRLKEDMYSTDKGFYYHRRYGFILSKMNYIRWSTAPLLNALASRSLAGFDSTGRI